MARWREAETVRSANAVDLTRLADDNDAPATGREHHPSDSAVPLVLSVAEAAEALGVSDDLIYELITQGELPCLALGRRKLVPRLAIELLVESAMEGFEPDAVFAVLSRLSTAGPKTPT